MLTYRAIFSRVAAGLAFEAVNRHTGDVTSISSDPEVDLNSDGLIYRVELAEGDYTARAKNSDGKVLYTSNMELDEPASIANVPGASETDGVGAVFFGGENLAVNFDNTYNFSPFVNVDEPPRAPQRDDLMVIDGEDDTTINVVRSGLYDISLNVPVRPIDLVVGEGEGPWQLEAVIQVWVAGNSFPPAYDYNNRAQWIVSESAANLATVFTNWNFPQVLQAGDTIQLAVKATAIGSLGTLGGTIHLDPDITFVLTYRGPVTLPA